MAWPSDRVPVSVSIGAMPLSRFGMRLHKWDAYVGIGHRDLTHPFRVKWSPILKLKLTYMDHVSLFPLGLKKDFLTMCQILRLRYTSVSKHMPVSICWGILTEPRTNQSANFCSFCPTNTKSTCNFGTGF